MICTLRIDGYRGFRSFEMSGLGRVNLLVGRNNSGKTSVLEALHLLNSAGDPMAMWQHCRRRGETLTEVRDTRYPLAELDIAHLFSGHELQVGGGFTVSARNQVVHRSVKFSIEEPNERERDMFASPGSETEGVGGLLVLRIQASPEPAPQLALPFSRRGGISIDLLDGPRRLSRRNRASIRNTLYVSTESLSSEELVKLWDEVQLTPHEDLVLRALRCLDPKIERIAAVAGSRLYEPGRGGFKVKLENYSSPFPIGNLGGGIWRMLAMAIAVTQCQNGILLVDEIDTGLHHSVMEDMWRLIFSAANDFNVQVFATTHSDDCVRSLAAMCHPDAAGGGQITIQRIEAGRGRSVPFTEPEIRIAAERRIEIR